MTDCISRDQCDPYWDDPEAEKAAQRRSHGLREAQEAYWEMKAEIQRLDEAWKKEEE